MGRAYRFTEKGRNSRVGAQEQNPETTTVKTINSAPLERKSMSGKQWKLRLRKEDRKMPA